jgi:molybdopterin/thiamine biosynthesis adenylyltransferase
MRTPSVAHLVQVGAGSGGMTVLDVVARDPRITRITLIEPDVYKPHNVVRHLLPPAGVGRRKAELARDWLLERRPELEVAIRCCDLLAPDEQDDIAAAVQSADLGVCAADNEPAKYHWDTLMRRFGKPWTLGEVLAGGIGGFVHRFVPGGPCYGCVASFLKRSVTTETPVAPDYSQPGGPTPETTIPASRASIEVIASLHAHLTLQLLEPDRDPGFTSMLFTLEPTPGIFDEAYRPHRFRIPRLADCLICRPSSTTDDVENLDAALDEALNRLHPS